MDKLDKGAPLQGDTADAARMEELATSTSFPNELRGEQGEYGSGVTAKPRPPVKPRETGYASNLPEPESTYEGDKAARTHTPVAARR